jgi:hypothetical protein
LAKVGESRKSEQNRLVNVGESGESEQNRLANVGESGESGTFQKKTILANSRASGYSFGIYQFKLYVI